MTYNQGYYLHEKSIKEIGNRLISAVEMGDINEAKYIINLPNFIENDMYPYYLNDCLGESCIRGYFEFVKYLLTSNELSIHADINFGANTPLVNACDHGHLNIVEYLLTSSELDKKADIHDQFEGPLRMACISDQVHVIKYLLSASDLFEHSNLYADRADFFYYCIKEPNEKKIEMMNFIIFELNIPKCNTINKYLEKFPNEEIENMFKVRDIQAQLQDELNKKNQNQLIKKNKI